jgi:hypothetical protein
MNENATAVLDAYLDARELSVPHAILLTGPWGSGKTYFLQKIYEPQREERHRLNRVRHAPFLFVSLFGAASAAEVEMRIYKAACPGEAVVGGLAGTISLGIGEFLRVKDTAKVVTGKITEKAIKRLGEFVFVLDDLERVEPDAFGEVIGLINSFVALHERRVILVTDEDKLFELQDAKLWKDQNEKLVGRRANIMPDVASVVQTNLAELKKGPAKSALLEHVDELISVAVASGVTNLRNLSWALHNAVAFVQCFANDDEIPPEHLRRTMLVVLATTLWLREGKVNAKALAALSNLSLTRAVRSLGQSRGRTEENTDVLDAEAFSVAFRSLRVETPPVEYKAIIDFERSGVLDCEELVAQVKARHGFGKLHEEAAWRTIWYSHARPKAETDAAVERLGAAFERREIRNAQVILQTVGLAVKLRKANDTRLTRGADITPFFKGYVDEMEAAGLLELGNIDPDAYESLGYANREAQEFNHLLEHLKEKRGSLAETRRAERLEAIIQRAEDGDLDALFELVSPDDPEIHGFPILGDVDVGRIARLFSGDVPELSQGAKTLAFRYAELHEQSPLVSEIPWARRVYAAVVAILETWGDPHRSLAIDHLNGTLRYYEKDRPAHLRILEDEPNAEP